MKDTIWTVEILRQREIHWEQLISYHRWADMWLSAPVNTLRQIRQLLFTGGWDSDHLDFTESVVLVDDNRIWATSRIYADNPFTALLYILDNSNITLEDFTIRLEIESMEKGQGLIEYALIIVLIAVVVIVVGAVLTDTYITSETELQRYTRLYNDCIAAETIDAARCHDIALEQVYRNE